jgi:hypothetical protein
MDETTAMIVTGLAFLLVVGGALGAWLAKNDALIARVERRRKEVLRLPPPEAPPSAAVLWEER